MLACKSVGPGSSPGRCIFLNFFGFIFATTFPDLGFLFVSLGTTSMPAEQPRLSHQPRRLVRAHSSNLYKKNFLITNRRGVSFFSNLVIAFGFQPTTIFPSLFRVPHRIIRGSPEMSRKHKSWRRPCLAEVGHEGSPAILECPPSASGLPHCVSEHSNGVAPEFNKAEFNKAHFGQNLIKPWDRI